jgi:hypothetical protein
MKKTLLTALLALWATSTRAHDDNRFAEYCVRSMMTLVVATQSFSDVPNPEKALIQVITQNPELRYQKEKTLYASRCQEVIGRVMANDKKSISPSAVHWLYGKSIEGTKQ